MATQNGSNSSSSSSNREFVEGWTLAQTLGEGAYGEYVAFFFYLLI